MFFFDFHRRYEPTVFQPGTRFGNLTVIGFAGKIAGKYCHKVRCDCGIEKTVSTLHLIYGHTRSCGRHKQGPVKHGYSRKDGRPRLYNIWRHMIDRCGNERNEEYHRYGGRGISVCESWKDYKFFMEWSLGHGYEDTLTIDRIDNNKGYCPENCRWATKLEQSHNREDNHWVIVNGERMVFKAMCDKYGIDQRTMRKRLEKMTIEEALAKPVAHRPFRRRNKARV